MQLSAKSDTNVMPTFSRLAELALERAQANASTDDSTKP